MSEVKRPLLVDAEVVASLAAAFFAANLITEEQRNATFRILDAVELGIEAANRAIQSEVEERGANVAQGILDAMCSQEAEL